MPQQTLKSALSGSVRVATSVIGRKRMARMARWLNNEVRFDLVNQISSNGEKNVQRVAARPGEPVIFDVGSHFGEWALSLASENEVLNMRRKRAGEPLSRPRVYAFEPSAHSFDVATRKLVGIAEVHQVALSSSVGRGELRIVHQGAGSNSLTPFKSDERRASGVTETVRLETVDSFAADHQVENITLLKVDAEGHDLEVLKGATGLLSRKAIGIVQFEYNTRWIDSRSFLLDAFELLVSKGYQVGKVIPYGVETYPGWHFELETFREGNYLAYLPEWQSRFVRVPWWNN